jgi:hypothetical protein
MVSVIVKTLAASSLDSIKVIYFLGQFFLPSYFIAAHLRADGARCFCASAANVQGWALFHRTHPKHFRTQAPEKSWMNARHFRVFEVLRKILRLVGKIAWETKY